MPPAYIIIVAQGAENAVVEYKLGRPLTSILMHDLYLRVNYGDALNYGLVNRGLRKTSSTAFALLSEFNFLRDVPPLTGCLTCSNPTLLNT